MSNRDEALKQIIELATEHKVSVREFANHMHASEEQQTHYAPTRRLFAYLSGICIFSGISAYINMFWHEMNSFERVIITLGCGIALHVMALVSLRDGRYARAASPLFLMSSVLIPTGLFVLFFEWPVIYDPRYQALAVFGFMLVQQSATFYTAKLSTLLFFILAYGAAFFATIFDLLGMSDTFSGIIIGASLLCLSYGINKIRHTSMSGFWYLFGGLLFLGYSFDLLRGSYFEILYLGIACAMVYMSVLSHSRILMTVSVGAMLSYIAYFTIEHFEDSIGWPVTLILLGVFFSAVSAEAWKLNRKFFQNHFLPQK
jgi:hypothetical protein